MNYRAVEPRLRQTVSCEQPQTAQRSAEGTGQMVCQLPRLASRHRQQIRDSGHGYRPEVGRGTQRAHAAACDDDQVVSKAFPLLAGSQGLCL